MLDIYPCEPGEVTRIACPCCHEKIPRVGLKKDSVISGLTFKCRRCGKFFEVTTIYKE